MKLHLFYIKTNNENSYPGIAYSENFSIINGDKYFLYGFTNIKDVAKRFKEERSKELFYEKIVDVTKEEYDLFYNSNMDLHLDYCELITKIIVNNIYKTKTVYLILSVTEYMYIEDYRDESYMELFGEIIEHAILDPKIYNLIFKCLKPKIEVALRDHLLFEDFLPSDVPYEEYLANIILDELSIFTFIFKNTLK